MWSSIFSWATDMTDLCSSSQHAQFFRDYFMDSSVCGEVIGISFLISLLICVAFYFGIGNFSFTLSKRITWIIVLVLNSVLIFGLSDSYIIGSDGGSVENSSGLYMASYKTESNLIAPEGKPMKKGDEAKRIRRIAQGYRDSFKQDSVSLPHDIAVVNSFYGLVFFIVLSLFLKRFSKHAKYIPF